jgi:hypothetical protein
MDVKKVQDIVTWLAKSGDKETIKQIGHMLLEISNFSKSNKQEQKEPQRVQESVSSHASALLDGSPSSYTLFTPQQPTYERSYQPPQQNAFDMLSQYVQEPTPHYSPSTNDVPYTPGPRNLANNIGVTSHAADLL